VETSAISYRVADFLKRHAPFNSVDDEDLLALAGGGRVRFHEPNEYILWQGEPHRYQVFVLQQGTVSLWNESADGARLRDIRGAGDMLGIERYNDAPACLYSARSETDVVLYAFAAPDFETFVLKYPHAARYVTAESRVTPDYQPSGDRRELGRRYLHEVATRSVLPSVATGDSIADAARRMLSLRADSLLVTDGDHRGRGLLTSDAVLAWVARGAGNAQQPVETLLRGVPATVAPDASVADGVLAMGAADADAVAITEDGTAGGRVHALVSGDDLAPLFGENPATLLRGIRGASTTAELRALNQRARAFVLDQLTSAASTDWLARFTHVVDAAILARVAALTGIDGRSASWCFAGSSGRSESLTALAPALLAIFEDGVPDGEARSQYRRVLDTLLECGYLPRRDLPFDLDFCAARAGEWKTRFRDWIGDPVRQQTYRVRSLFDLRAIYGSDTRWHEVRAVIAESVDREFVHVLANDCLASLPPLTFFQNAVVDALGEQTSTFRLEHSALRPLVDVGRVFALAARDAPGRSTVERLAIARRMLAEQDAIFRDAADTLRIVLWQQGRVGISQGTDGSELPAAALSRYDRQALKSGFPVIQKLLEFTADLTWLTAL
jgi:CBS domain-containing protein